MAWATMAVPACCRICAVLRLAVSAAKSASTIRPRAAVVFSLGLFGVDRSQALAAGLVLHMVQYIPVTLAGLLVLGKSGLSLRKIRHSEEGLEEAQA